MVVVMTGSPNSAVLSPLTVETKRDKDREAAFKELQAEKVAKKKKAEEAKKAKKKIEDEKFKKRQDLMREQQKAERDERQKNRADALARIAQEHEGWVHREEAREQVRVEQGRQHTKDMLDGVHFEDDIEVAIQKSQDAMKDASWKAISAQQKLDEKNEADRQAKIKADREAKANEMREAVRTQAEAAAKIDKEMALRIKKGMALETAKQRQAEEAHQADLRKRGGEERKKNDEYDAWLAKDHIRTAQERGHERADPSKMHEGGKFSGIPTDFTPGK